MEENRNTEFEAFFKENSRLLYRIIAGYLKNRENAEELVLDVFMKIHRKWDKVGGLENPVGYLVRAAKNECMSFLRTKKKRVYKNTMEEESLPDNRHPESLYFIEAENRVLEEFILRLNDRERNVLLLRRLESRPFSEIGSILNIKENTARSLYMRAKKKLLKWLEESNEM